MTKYIDVSDLMMVSITDERLRCPGILEMHNDQNDDAAIPSIERYTTSLKPPIGMFID